MERFAHDNKEDAMEKTEIKDLARELKQLETKRQGGALSSQESNRHRELVKHLFSRFRDHPSAERRKFLRVPGDLEVKFQLGDATFSCGATEISLGGLSLKGNLWVIEDQELIILNLKLGQRDYPMLVRAKVVWKLSGVERRPRAGLKFINLTSMGARQIQAVFEQLFLNFLDDLGSS